tara:strand:- start:1162 stop:1386 length:225 start_codon:yes stop_codon:yes gene_type:complete
MRTTKNKLKEISAEKLAEFFPRNLQDVIDLLEIVYPYTLPNKNTPDREIWIEVGKQEIITFLKNKLKKEEEDVY